MKFVRYLIILAISTLLLNCAFNPITGKTELAASTARVVDMTMDQNFRDIYYLRLNIGNLANQRKIESIIRHECDKIAIQKSFSNYEVVDVNVVDEGIYRNHIYEIKFYKKKPTNPCDDEIFKIVERKGIRNLTDREFEIYKLKTEECNELKKRHELNKQTKNKKNQNNELTQAIFVLALVISIIFLP